ncbi:MAG: hypothetical protein M1820_002397 [Bogoriella megaspora]|nr:MAG: hypothetical protein M1820_002397 [Bogoriella megaspora]
MDLDLVVKNGVIVTASEVLPTGQDIGIKDGKIVCIGSSLPQSQGTKVVDAQGGYITPGGVDSHVHLSQLNCPTGDNWETGSRSAIAGGTTTIIAFASQQKTDDSLIPVLKDYHGKCTGQSYTDYGFHFILTKPNTTILDKELPMLAKEEGITSVKLYMTYEPMKLRDRELLDIMMACRGLGMTTMIHAENSDMIDLIIERLEARGLTEPYYHALARPQLAESEASYRAICLAEAVDAPVLLVHMSSETALEHVRAAQARLLPIHAETCPQYLYLLSERLKGTKDDHYHGAKCVCSPPLKHEPADLDNVWKSVANGTITTFSSDHAPSKYYVEGGKRLGLIDGIPKFTKIPNGLPGVETRMPLLFDRAGNTEDGARITLPRFVQITATNPAKLYGLDGVKGSIAPGYDADLVIWSPEKKDSVIITNSMLHHDIDYTPYEGMTIKSWPRYTILRGKIIWDRDNGGIVGEMGDGKYLKRKKGLVLNGRTGNRPKGMFEGEREHWL